MICKKVDTALKISVVRFDIDKYRALVSINLSPNMRSKGLVKNCSNKSIIFFRSTFPDISFIDAKIKTINKARKKMKA